MRAACNPTSAWEIAYGLVGGIAWCALALYWARRCFVRFVVGSVRA